VLRCRGQVLPAPAYPNATRPQVDRPDTMVDRGWGCPLSALVGSIIPPEKLIERTGHPLKNTLRFTPCVVKSVRCPPTIRATDHRPTG